MALTEESAPGFEHPLELLRACHRRIERFAGLADRITGFLEEGSAPAERVRETAGQVLRYFDEAAPLHHADEERDLLPRLRHRLAQRPDPELEELLEGLAAEHGDLEGQWRELRPRLVALRDGQPVDPAGYGPAAASFRETQMDHLSREEARLLPAAEALLQEEDIAELGNAMAQRRGVRQNG